MTDAGGSLDQQRDSGTGEPDADELEGVRRVVEDDHAVDERDDEVERGDGGDPRQLTEVERAVEEDAPERHRQPGERGEREPGVEVDHVVGYGGHVHEPAQTFVDGEFAYRGTLVGRYAELQELVALVDRGDVELRTTRYDPGGINTVAERLEGGEIAGRAVITPSS
jgi:hypothetical protein